MIDKTAYEADINKTEWTLLADFTKLRIKYFHLQLLTPLGTKVIFSFMPDIPHMIARADDQSLTFDNRPIQGKLYAKITDGDDTAEVTAHIW